MLATSSTGHRASSSEGGKLGLVIPAAVSPAPPLLRGSIFDRPGIPLVIQVTDGFRRAELFITDSIVAHRIRLLHLSLGLVFFWFGVLKFFPGLSPAENLATRTIEVLTLGTIHPAVSIVLLATWECAVGIALGFRLCLRATLCLLFVHMVCTFMPILFFPGEVFTHFPYGLTLEGQYIIKNLVLMSAAMMLWPTGRTDKASSYAERCS